MYYAGFMTTTTKVYRIGSLTCAEHSENVQKLWSSIDAVKPEGRAGRLECLYASPNIKGLIRWIRGMHFVAGRDESACLDNHEITVINPETVFVYHVPTYDAVGSGRKSAESYWESGIPLSEWQKVAEEKGLNAEDWEILLPMNAVKSSRKISNARILGQAEDEMTKRELSDMFKDRARVMRF